MCYTVFLSTDSTEDLSAWNSKLMVLQPAAESEPLLKRLQFKNCWFLTDEHNCCSCEFRHLSQTNSDGSPADPEFFEPQDWMPEDPERVEGTRLLFDVIKNLVGRGFKVDLIDVWNEREAERFVLDVDLALVKRDSFHMFEDFKMRFR